MSYLLGVVLFAVGILVTIGLHEWGHYRAAKSTGMLVRRFFVGFGPTVFSYTRNGTEYGLKAIPLGGFCDIAGMTAQDPVTEAERPYAMVHKSAWQRVLVLSGGIIMNIFVAFVLLYTVAASSGLPNLNADFTPTVGTTQCLDDGECPAIDAGVEEGDRILKINGEEMLAFVQVRDTVRAQAGQTIVLTVERDGAEREISVPVAKSGAIGVTSAPIKDPIKVYGPLEAVPATLQYSGSMLQATVQGLAAFPGKLPGVAASIVGQERDKEGPVSVVGASRVGGELAERSQWAMFLMMLASLNFFLALFNLVPLPPLDGGHIAVVAYEKVRDVVRKLRGLQPGGPANYDKLMPLTMAVSALLVGAGVLVIVADVVNPVRAFG
ncbi:RIP metalloprotease [Corynebacterium sp.]|uniref:M50 family metallopeptidase n=1 Tax=Corynebacterium sp. TaxID=1720 RepID=UPI0026DCA96B|nr:M50 family metallopeptidase [Corynebacterium sp.]MDO5075800.1 M50 family metallopeptidase [Corynebacterium sp.]